jgi:hypothetical protein
LRLIESDDHRAGYTKEMSHGRLHYGVGRNRLYRPPSGGAACSEWRATVPVAASDRRRVQVTTQSDQAAKFIQADLLDDVAVAGAIAGTGAVVNLVGILTETATQTYRATHAKALVA